MIGAMQEDRPGMLVVDLAGDGTATLERTEALGRAKLLGADDVVTSIKATHGVRHGDRSEFWPVKTAPPAPGKEPVPPVRKPVKDTPTRDVPSPTGSSAGSSAKKPAQARPESWLGRLRTRPRSG
jgi:hypothetical protein